MNNTDNLRTSRSNKLGVRGLLCLGLAWMLSPLAQAQNAAVDPACDPPVGAAGQISLNVIRQNNQPIPVGFRWLVEEDATFAVTPGAVQGKCALAVNLHRSYMPVVASGHSNASAVTINVPDSNKRYYVSVVPDQGTPGSPADCSTEAGQCFTQTGRQAIFAPGTTSTTVNVVVTPQPLPTSQIWVRAFEDVASINNAWDTGEAGLGGFMVFIYDMGGQLATDTFGNPLGTTYVDGSPGTVVKLGDGTVRTMTALEADDPARNPQHLAVGEALIQNLAPGKYGIQIIPKAGEGWQQTHTIEGTKGIDAWILAGESRYALFAEFGPGFHHADIGFVKPMNKLAPGGTGAIRGRAVNMHMTRPRDNPPDYSMHAGHPLPGCWIGLNTLLAGAVGQGLYVAACNDDSTFQIPNVPDGTYQLVIWDSYLLNIFAAQTVTMSGGVSSIAANPGGVAGYPDIPVFRWFGTHEHWVFNDLDGDGMRDANEVGIPEQIVNLRYRDGSIYAMSATDTEGYVPFDAVFPFFSWLVTEVDFARFKATGLTTAVDAGGPVTGTFGLDFGPGNIGHGVMAAQPQDPTDGGTNCGTAGCETRTEVGPVLTQGVNTFLGTTTTFEWGKQSYAPGENGGISGIVQYATTRAENDPRYAAAETWETGIPRVQVNLYRSAVNGAIDPTVNGVAGVQLADVDNYPFDWMTTPGALPGAEDLDRNGNGVFDGGDAINIARTDSWDDNPPTNCPGDAADTFHDGDGANGNSGRSGWAFDGKCYDGMRNYQQARPAVFDGGYAFFDHAPAGWTAALTEGDMVSLPVGNYVVEANTPPGYLHQTEESKNVDFGDAFKVKAQALPPVCVGDAHTVPGELTLFPGVEAPFAGQPRPMCDRKVAVLADGKNTGVSFFMYTEVPVSGHIKGFVLNDLTNEFNPQSPNFGEKFAPSWLPISIRDYAGNEINHVYTDEFGVYNALIPSSYRINVPMPSGVSPNMAQVCLNSPVMQDPAHPGVWIPDPHFDKHYSQFCYSFNFTPGQTTYADTPILPIAAYTGDGNFQLDAEYPDHTPVISSVNAMNTKGGGPYMESSAGTITLTSRGTIQVPDPSASRIDGSSQMLVTRDYGFGAPQGTVRIGGVALTVTSWTNDVIVATVPANTRTGQVSVQRADGNRSRRGVTFTIGLNPNLVVPVAPGGSIQAAIDAVPAGGLVLVAPGSYSEMLFLTKPIALQGWGADSSFINAVQSPVQKIERWRVEANRRVNCVAPTSADRIGLLPGQANNTGPGANACSFPPGTGLFNTIEGPGVLVAPADGVFAAGRSARIDGLTITGSDQSAAILANGYAHFLEIGNNVITSNQGPAASGIRIGHPTLLAGDTSTESAYNDNVYIHHNLVAQNGGLVDPGAGIGLYTGSDAYRVVDNFISGNFAKSDGAGIAHYGYSPGGLIADNDVVFNQGFDQTVAGGGNAGGILIAGHEQEAAAAVTQSVGSGSVTVLRNRIQGNQAGSGDGGGIVLRRVNGQDVLASGNNNTGTWHTIDILNNLIVNNVAGYRAGGIIMQDALRVRLVNNTIANNDSTATAGNALPPAIFTTAGATSTAQPAGVVLMTPSNELLTGLSGQQLNQVNSQASRPQLYNNIVLGNRSLVWTTTTPIGGVANSPGSGAGTLQVATRPFWDVAVAGGPQTALNLVSNLFTDVTGVSYPAGNLLRPADIATEKTVMVNPYFNCSPPPPGATTCVLGDGTVTSAEFTTLLTSAAALDEGGNFIDVHYGPLTLGDSNYHLVPASPAINQGSTNTPNSAYLQTDIDGNPRVARYDIGADEYAAANANVAPQIIPDPVTLQVLQGTNVAYRVPATDPNPGSVLSYSITQMQVRSGNGNNFVPVNWGSVLPPSMDPVTGVITWNAQPVPGFNGNNNGACNGGGNSTNRRRDFRFTVAVSDGTATTSGRVDVQVCRPSTDQLDAANDAYAVNTVGTYTQLAPGVLDNDTNPNADRGGAALVASLVTDTPNTVGHVAVASTGGFTFTPVLTWVGTTTFAYSATDGANTDTATVTLSRTFAPTVVRFTNGGWTLSGMRVPGNNTPSCYRATLDRNGNRIGAAYVASNATSWSITSTSQPFQAGDTVTITSYSTNSQNQCTGNSNNVTAVATMAALTVNGNTATQEALTTAFVQCPGDTNGDGQLSNAERAALPPGTANRVCRHLAAGDGYVQLADGKELYTFGFSDVSDRHPTEAISAGLLNAAFPAPTLVFDEGDEVFLTLTNVGMIKRPDLFDPHSVHFHGFPNAATVFDGVPESGISVNMGSSLTYFYKIVDAGTFMYHCHVEAAEHMQMGMLGNLYVRPRQNKLAAGTLLGSYAHRAGDLYAYNDGDGSTRYDVEAALQIGSMDSVFHDEHIAVQPLPFASMKDDYGMLNGRGYPQTVDPANIPVVANGEKATSGVENANASSQLISSLVEARQGQRILVRLTNLNVTRFYTMGITGGLSMQIVGQGGHILRGPGGENLYRETGSITLGGGESADVIIDTTGVAPGTYVLYSKNLDALSNGEESTLGGMMTEIRIAP